MEFIKDVGIYFDKVYPSRTYCAIEEYSNLHKDPAKFNIQKDFSHHLYWKTKDGENTYPVRLKRCKIFEDFCLKMGVGVDCGVQTDVKLDECFNLGYYYYHINDYKNAIKYFMEYKEIDPKNKMISNILDEIKVNIK